MKIVIATPLYPPDLGGPATYAKHLGDEFRTLGHEARIVVFSPLLRLPSGIRHLVYLARLLRAARGADVLFTLDYMSAGIPAMIASVLLRIPLVLRFEGDFFWERTAERTRRDLTLREFVLHPPMLPLKDRLLMWLGRCVIRRARGVACSSEWRRSMLGALHDRAVIIPNALPEYRAPQSHGERERVVLWAGRMMHLKNLRRLIRAFAAVGDARYELHLLGDGPERAGLEDMVKREGIARVRFFPPVAREALMTRMAGAAFYVLPSLSDVWPNVIVEAIATKTPFLMTRESGLAEFVKDIGIVVDPTNDEDIRRALTTLMDDDTRRIYEKKLGEWRFRRSWREAAEEWVSLCKKVIMK